MRNAENAGQTVAAVSARSWAGLAGGGDTAADQRTSFARPFRKFLTRTTLNDVVTEWLSVDLFLCEARADC